jgi:hypothetical protein
MPIRVGAGARQRRAGTRTARRDFRKNYFFDLLSGSFTQNLMVAEHISNG